MNCTSNLLIKIPQIHIFLSTGSILRIFDLFNQIPDKVFILISTNQSYSGYVSPRSLSRDKSPLKMFCKRLYEKPMNMVYHSQIKNKSITAYKPISGSIRKAKVILYHYITLMQALLI